MRQTAKILVWVTMAVLACWASASQAAFFGFPGAIKLQLAKLGFDRPALPPMGHTLFCLRYPRDCRVQAIDFRHRNVALTTERWEELNLVNREVNRDIIADTSVTDEWMIAPQVGDCKDYAVTKRHELLSRGWPSRALLLAEVVVPSGEHHLVLVVRTSEVDLVLDNLSANIRSIAVVYPRYQWVRMESPQNPKFWTTVSAPRAPDAMTAPEPSRLL
jgi:predicted transglutaminase-like cysteine proteinase